MVTEIAETVMSPQSADFIERLGFPVFITIILVLVIMWYIREDRKRQVVSDERYSKIVDQFVSSVTAITKEQSQAMQAIALQLERLVDIVNQNIKAQAKDWDQVVDELKQLKTALSSIKER